jgi:outer membrane protein assembly factor BamE (lipoprotein component of BamABCDE complex)
MKNKIFILLAVIVLSGCSAHKYGQSVEPTQKSNLTFGVVKSQIEKGVTTQDEILKIFGAPNLVTKNKSNNEVWSYNKMSVEEREGNQATFFGGRKASASSSSQSFDLIVSFDDNDIVKDYSVISSSY